MTVREFLKAKIKQYDEELQELSGACEGRSLIEYMGEWNERAGMSNFLAIQSTRKVFYQSMQWLVELPCEVLEAEIREGDTE